MEKVKWIERDFKTDERVKLFPNFIERLRGTPARLEDKLDGLSINRLVKKIDDAWSIQEHAGHLLDLEELWNGRLDDFDDQIDTLRPADMTNQKTDEANHNENSLKTILADFRATRQAMCERLDALSLEEVTRTALHPRLQQPMNVIDLISFVAEHDDHHLSSMQELIVKMEKK